MRGLESEKSAQALAELLLLARPGGGNEYRVVARNSADDLAPASRIDGYRNALCRADGGSEDREIRARSLRRSHELLECRKILFDRRRIFRQHVAIAALG